MKTFINLMPASLRRQQLVRRRVAQWGRVLVVLAAAMWWSHWCLSREQEGLLRRLEILALEHRPTQTMLRELIAMREELTDMEQQQRIARELERQRNVLSLLGIVSETARRTEGRLRVTKLDVSELQAIAPEDAKASGEGGAAVVAGVSLDNPSVAEMFDGLQNSGFFRRVELVALKARHEDPAALRDYEVKCEL